jgi:hypothetical protein
MHAMGLETYRKGLVSIMPTRLNGIMLSCFHIKGLHVASNMLLHREIIIASNVSGTIVRVSPSNDERLLKTP